MNNEIDDILYFKDCVVFIWYLYTIISRFRLVITTLSHVFIVIDVANSLLE